MTESIKIITLLFTTLYHNYWKVLKCVIAKINNMAFLYPTLHRIRLCVSIECEIDIRNVWPCTCQVKPPAVCESLQSFLIAQVWKWRAFLSLFPLASSSHCSLYLCVFERLLWDSDFCSQQKTTWTKNTEKENKQRGLSCRDVFEKMKIRSCLSTHCKRAPPGHTGRCGSDFSFPVYHIYVRLNWNSQQTR